MIQVIEKPDSITYDEIREIIQQAHQENIRNGIRMNTTTLSAAELEQKVGENGKCFVAMDGEKVVGTISCREKQAIRWFYKGTVMEMMLFGIVPSYRGKHIASGLIEAVEKETGEKNRSVILFDTAFDNSHMIELGKKKGYLLVNFFAPPTSHYSVEMAKWLDNCPFSRGYVALRYWLKKLYVQFRFKPGRRKRFGM